MQTCPVPLSKLKPLCAQITELLEEEKKYSQGREYFILRRKQRSAGETESIKLSEMMT